MSRTSRTTIDLDISDAVTAIRAVADHAFAAGLAAAVAQARARLIARLAGALAVWAIVTPESPHG